MLYFLNHPRAFINDKPKHLGRAPCTTGRAGDKELMLITIYVCGGHVYFNLESDMKCVFGKHDQRERHIAADTASIVTNNNQCVGGEGCIEGGSYEM